MASNTEGPTHIVTESLEQKGEFAPDDLTLLGQASAEQLKSIRGYLRGTHQIIENNKEGNFLRPIAPWAASGEDVLNENGFFRRINGVWVSDSFRKRFRSTFQKSRASDRKYISFGLSRFACDTAIRTDLPESHLSKLGDIARLIKAQLDGRPGILLADYGINIFYVENKDGEVFSVNVSWYSDHRTWYVIEWALDEHGVYCAGSARVLRPCNAVL